MKPFFALFIFGIFFSISLFSQEIFLDKNWESSKGIYSKTQSFCHPTKEGNTFCQKEALSYPLFMHAPDQKIRKTIEKLVQKAIKDFDKGDLQKSILQNLE